MSNLTLYSLIQRNGSDALVGLIEDVTTYSPEFSQIPVIIRAGTSYNTLTRTALPQAQFRGANQAITASCSTYKQSIHEMFFIDAPVVVDEFIYKGDDGSTGDLLYQEGQGVLQNTINLIGSQTWYGQANDGSQGFVGIRAQLLPTGSGITPVTASAVNNSTTCYGLWLNPQGVNYAVGKHGEIAFPPFIRQYVTPTPSSAGYFAWVSNISSFIGLQVGSIDSVFGITGITQAAPLTDKLGSQLVATVPMVRRAGFTWFMNRLSHSTLQQSRTAINFQPASAQNGSPAWSPRPTEMEGFPIIVTDSITNTENNT